MPPSVHLYRPQRTRPETLERTFVAREPLLTEILAPLRSWQPGASRQHHLLIGPRGIGKTNLLQLAAHRIRSESDLKARWVPVVLPEDFYGLARTSDLLLNSLSLLAEETGSDAAEEVFAECQYDDDHARVSDRCLDAFRDFHRRHGRGVVLMVENLDRLIERQSKQRIEAHRLRRILIEEDWLVALCTSPTYFDAVSSPDEPFFEFFKVQALTELSPEEQEEMLRRLAAEDDRQDFDEYLDRFRPRLRALYHFTGGNPRLTVMLYDLLAHQKVGQVRNELDLLLDQLTPFYQDRMKEISAQEAKVLEHMALLPEGCTPTELAREARLPPASVRATFTRLERGGYVRRQERRRKRTIYVIPERFFRIWHQMNHSRAARGQLQYLLEFFSNWYASREDRDRVWEELTASLARGLDVDDEERTHDVAEFMDYIVAASEGAERYQRLFDHFRQRFEAGLVESMEGELDDLDRKHTGDADYFLCKGYFLAVKLDRLDLASEALEQAIRLKKTDLVTYFNYGIAQARQGKLDNARRAFKEAADILVAQESDQRDTELGLLLVRILASSDQTHAKYASFLLGALADSEALGQVAALLGSLPEPWRRRYCVNTLGYSGDRSSISVLITALLDRAAQVRGSAATALGRIADLEARPPLIETLKDSASDVRGSAATALGRIADPDAVPPLIKVLKDSDLDVRSSAAIALGRIGRPEAAPHLSEALNDPAAKVRRNAAVALGRLTVPLDTESLLQLVRILAEVTDSSARLNLLEVFDSFLQGTFLSSDTKAVHAALEAITDVVPSRHSAAWTPHRIAYSYLRNGRDPAVLERQPSEMREAAMLLVALYDEGVAAPPLGVDPGAHGTRGLKETPKPTSQEAAQHSLRERLTERIETGEGIDRSPALFAESRASSSRSKRLQPSRAAAIRDKDDA